MKKLLSKSQANLFLQCPYKWKKNYIDNIRSLPSPAQKRGIAIHKKVESFYKNPTADPDLKNLINFELQRVKSMINEGKFDKKYFYPLFQELKMQNKELGLKGICDAVYINPKDDKLIIIDWKTGKYYPNKFDDYRFELAVYAELLKHSGKVDEDPAYWGIYFTDQDKLFFEKIDKKYIDNMYETMEQVRKDIEKGDYQPKKNQWCFFCQFKRECPLMRWGR